MASTSTSTVDSIPTDDLFPSFPTGKYTTTVVTELSGVYTAGATTALVTEVWTLPGSGSQPELELTTHISTSFPGGFTTVTLTETIDPDGTATSVLFDPLTTIFIPPTSCMSEYFYDFAVAPYPLLAWSTKSECYPSGFSYPANGYTRGYFSPGICPSAYSSACVEEVSSSENSVSAYKCCPVGYGCIFDMNPAAIGNNYCYSYVQTATYAKHAIETSLEYVIENRGMVYAPAIRIRWHSSDITSLMPQPTATAPETTPQPDPSPALSNTAKIVIGVTVPAVIIGILVLALLLYRRRKSARSGSFSQEAVELDTNYRQPAEMDPDTAKYELPAIGPPVEIDSTPLPRNMDDEEIQVMPATAHVLHNHSLPRKKIPTKVAVDKVQDSRPQCENVKNIGEENGYQSRASEEVLVDPAALNPVTAEDDDEMRWLQEEQERLDERRARLRELQELDEQREYVGRRMQEKRERLGRRDGGL